MANLKKCDFMVHPNELRKCIIEIDEVWHELSQQQRYLAEITNQIHGHAHMSIDIIEQQNERLRQERDCHRLVHAKQLTHQQHAPHRCKRSAGRTDYDGKPVFL